MAYNIQAAEVDALAGATLAPAAEGEAAKKIEGRSPWRLAWQRLRHDRAAMISLASVVQIHPIGPIGPGLPVVIVVLGVLTWATVGRIVRGQVLSIREKEYIEAARALGARPWRIMFIDILPNLLAQLIVYATLLIPVTIVGEASLSFLGVGVQSPTADWGEMISAASALYLYG